MPPKDKVDKRSAPGYYVLTPIETLIDEGLIFDGETEKDRIINQFDFAHLREHIQRVDSTITPDIRETLIRYLKLCLKDPA
jgi:hypothetical protein